MELVEKYREIILQIFREYTEVPVAHGDLEDEIIIDREGDHYLWMVRGYQKHKRIHTCVARIDIHQWKVVGSTR